MIFFFFFAYQLNFWGEWQEHRKKRIIFYIDIMVYNFKKISGGQSPSRPPLKSVTDIGYGMFARKLIAATAGTYGLIWNFSNGNRSPITLYQSHVYTALYFHQSLSHSLFFFLCICSVVTLVFHIPFVHFVENDFSLVRDRRGFLFFAPTYAWVGVFLGLILGTENIFSVYN